MESRYLIGIDLGTTNIALSFLDTDPVKNPSQAVQAFYVPQLEKEGRIVECPLLPAFLYLPRKGEIEAKGFSLAWEEDQIAGVFAREMTGKTPNQGIFSAKSWLCQGGEDCQTPFLPLAAGEGQRKKSPVDVLAAFLSHLRHAWNQTRGEEEGCRLEDQKIAVTIPASFDESARELTLKAVSKAGFDAVSLLEEPQAAFYHWMEKNSFIFEKGKTILVCDIGGGTTDFSLLETTESKTGVKGFQRKAVGEHLLLGGDNLDLFLAYHFQREKFSSTLTPFQWGQLIYEARKVKEAAFEGKEKQFTLTLQGEGTRLVGNSLSGEVELEEVRNLCLKHFFPILPFEEAVQIKKKSALKRIGLPYEVEYGVTRHLAHFLHRQEAVPDFVLFNGGMCKAAPVQEAVARSLEKWFEKPVSILKSPCLDQAVSKGAAYFEKVKRGEGVSIFSGSSKAYFIEIEKEGRKQLLTVVERGEEEGALFEGETSFFVLANRPVSFQVYSSSVRLGDRKGEWIELDPKTTNPLPPMQTVLKMGSKQTGKIPVFLKVHFTEYGTLNISLFSKETFHSWKLEFSARNHETTLQGIYTSQDVALLESAEKLVKNAFSSSSDWEHVIKKLEDIAGEKKGEWSLCFLRALADALLEFEVDPRKNPNKSEKFWNLLGFSLRPGVGASLDAYRLQNLWRKILPLLDYKHSEPFLTQLFIAFRRISLGLGKGEQERLFGFISPFVLKGKDLIEVKGKQGKNLYFEALRALASFERVEPKKKIVLGEALIKKIQVGKGSSADFWALSRLGARKLLAAPIGYLISPEIAKNWLNTLLSVKIETSKEKALAIKQLSEETGVFELDLPGDLVKKAQIELKNGEFSFSEESSSSFLLGDSLPIGLYV